jgi:hypothetical protein
MPVRNIAKVERFFRASSGLDIDKSDVKRYGDFVNRKIGDLLIRAQAVAKANDRDIVVPFDLPITKDFRRASKRFAISTVISGWSRFWMTSSRVPNWMWPTATKSTASSGRSRVV